MTTERWFEQDIAQPIVVQHCEGVVFTADNNGNIIGVKLYKDGTAFNPSGTATCNVIRPDGVTVSFNGTVSGNMISATLPVTALTVPGVIGVILQSISGSVVTTVFKGQFTCEMTTTETVVAPSVPTSSLAQLTQDVIDLQNNKVNRAGDTMTGTLAMPTGVVYGSGSYAILYFKNGAGASTNIGYVGMNLSTRRLLLASFAPGNDNEIYYRLPAPAQNESAGGYDILTNKDLVVPVSVTTDNTRVTVQYNNTLLFLGKLVIVQIRLNIASGSSNISTNSQICQIGKTAYVPSSPGSDSSFSTLSAAPYGPMRLTPNGGVIVQEAIPSTYSGIITIGGLFVAA